MDTGIAKLTGKYQSIVSWLLKRSLKVLVVIGVLFVATGWLSKNVPTGFVPGEDQGFLFVDVQLPDAASGNRTAEVMLKIRISFATTHR